MRVITASGLGAPKAFPGLPSGIFSIKLTFSQRQMATSSYQI
jgi:hypothetical protein